MTETIIHRPGADLIRLRELHGITMEALRVHRRIEDAANRWRWEQVSYGLEKLMEAHNGNRSETDEHDSTDVPRVGR